MNRKNKKYKLVAFLFSIILIGIGYAYLTANLKITGTTKIGNARFDVHFENANLESTSSNVTYPSNSNSNLAQGIPVIKGENDTELEWNVILNQPGDYYTISADIVNAGDIDAKLDLDNSVLKIKIGDEEESTIGLNDISVRNYFVYEEDSFITIFGRMFNSDIQYINSGDTKKIAMQVIINKETITNEQWEAIKNKNINITIDLKYIQGVDNPTSVSNSNSQSNSNGLFSIRYDNATFVGAGLTTEFPNNVNVPTIVNSMYDEDFPISSHDIEYSVIFNQPGDYYEFTMDLINDGDEDTAPKYLSGRSNKIQIGDGETYSFTHYHNLPSALDDLFEYSVVDEDNYSGWDIYAADAGVTQHITVKLKLKEDITAEQLALVQGKIIRVKYELYKTLYEYFESSPK